jgi:hypothetical protein
MHPYVYDVLLGMLHPVAAAPGDLLIVRPGHPTHAVAVVRQVGGSWQLVRLGPPNYGGILVCEYEGIISQRYPVSASLADHPLLRSA